MKGFNLTKPIGLGLVGTSSSWTCRRCALQAQRGLRTVGQAKGYATRLRRIPRPRRKGRILLAATGGALGVTTLAFTDEIRHSYEAVERTGRVVSTLALCINE